MNRLRRLCGMLLLGSLVGVAVAQDKTEPEPMRPAIPRGFRMYLIADGRYGPPEVSNALLEEKRKAPKDDRNRVGKMHDPVTEYGLYSVIGVFVRGVPAEDKERDGVLAVLKKEQELADKYRLRRLGAFMAFLALDKDFAEDDKRDVLIPQIVNLSTSTQKDKLGNDVKTPVAPLVAIGLAEGSAPQVEAWQLAADDYLTVVFYHRFKLVKRWKFKVDALPGDAELKAISDEVDALMGKVRADEKK